MALSGPFLPPARGPATHLVVLVHGYGADGQDLIGLAQHWRDLLPTVAFAAPNAPMRVPGSAGYQWFPISRIDPHEMQKGVEVAGPALDDYLDGELARLGLGPEQRDRGPFVHEIFDLVFDHAQSEIAFQDQLVARGEKRGFYRRLAFSRRLALRRLPKGFQFRIRKGDLRFT